MAACPHDRPDQDWLLQVLAKGEGFRQKPFEWNYEGLKPLLLHEVLASRRGMTLSLCILFSCVARRLGLVLTPVPATGTGGGSYLLQRSSIIPRVHGYGHRPFSGSSYLLTIVLRFYLLTTCCVEKMQDMEGY